MPDDVRVRSGWQERLEHDRIGAAVLDASTDAVRDRQRRWIQQIDDSRLSRRRRAFSEGMTPAADVSLAMPAGRARPDDPEFGEQVITALQQARRHAAAPPPAAAAEGTDPGRHVTLRLGPGPAQIHCPDSQAPLMIFAVGGDER
jgi:hypothetical protein